MSQMTKNDFRFIEQAEYIPWDSLKGKTVFVTGATGLIGSSLIAALLYVNQTRNLGLRVLALVRDMDRANKRFEDLSVFIGKELIFVLGSVEELPEISEKIDFLIHGASSTSSKFFVEQPVETIKTAVGGTVHVLELAREKKVESLVYLSSMEVYGYPERGHKVTEADIGAFSPLDARNSYPLSKAQCENLCFSYAKEYHVPAKIIRLTQTFGPDVNDGDNRISAYFGCCVKEKKDIVLKTKGETERSYLYTRDAVTAILAVLFHGENGKAYNAADEKSYCSIAQFAESIAARAGLKVIYDIQPESQNGFPQTLYMDLDTTELKKLGWSVGEGDSFYLE